MINFVNLPIIIFKKILEKYMNIIYNFIFINILKNYYNNYILGGMLLIFQIININDSYSKK